MNQLITSELGDDGVLMACIDMPGRSMNVFSEPLIDALRLLIDRVESDAGICGVVLSSAKPAFLAGADLSMVLGMTERATRSSANEMFEYCGRLGRLFLRIEQSAKPWVAAVNGTALGGGLELAMACRVRLIKSDAKALLGLPEVKLGLLPGAGGTQRLPRLVGLKLGLDLLLSGRSIDPAAAIAAGLFEAAPGAQSLLASARQRVHSLLNTQVAQKPESTTGKFAVPLLDCPADQESEVRRLALENGLSDAALRDYPAYRAIIRSVLAGGRLSLQDATDLEMTRFLDLMFNPVAGNMVTTLFVERQRVEKSLAAQSSQAPESIGLGHLSADRVAWREALMRTGIPITDDNRLGANQAEFKAADKLCFRVLLDVVAVASKPVASESAAVLPVLPVLLLSERSDYGRVIEWVGGGSIAVATRAQMQGVLAALARQLQCLLFCTPLVPSVLRELAAAKAIAAPAAINAVLAEVAARASAAGRVTDPAALDLAAVLSGISPAYSGGPFRFAQFDQRNS